MYPPKYVKNAYGEYKYYYNNADKSIYVFASDADAQAFAPNMEELCLESVLPGAAPGVCALYLQTGAVDLGETNPVQIYIRQINATGTPITGWLTSKNNLGMAAVSQAERMKTLCLFDRPKSTPQLGISPKRQASQASCSPRSTVEPTRSLSIPAHRRLKLESNSTIPNRPSRHLSRMDGPLTGSRPPHWWAGSLRLNSLTRANLCPGRG